MIEAMAQEAKVKTNVIFQKKIKSSSTTLNLFQSNLDSLLYKQKTQLQRELFMLRVKELLTTQLDIGTKSVSSKKVIALWFDNDSVNYGWMNEKGEISIQTLDGEKFKDIINTLKEGFTLSETEKNRILLELAQKDQANMSKRVSKTGAHVKAIMTHAEKINDAAELATVLDQLPKERRFNFAIYHADKIKSTEQLAMIFAILPQRMPLGVCGILCESV